MSLLLTSRLLSETIQAHQPLADDFVKEFNAKTDVTSITLNHSGSGANVVIAQLGEQPLPGGSVGSLRTDAPNSDQWQASPESMVINQVIM